MESEHNEVIIDLFDFLIHFKTNMCVDDDNVYDKEFYKLLIKTFNYIEEYYRIKENIHLFRQIGCQLIDNKESIRNESLQYVKQSYNDFINKKYYDSCQNLIYASNTYFPLTF
jgi:hypothetical protein